MAKRKSKSNAGISRIDQREKRTHGYFVRLTRNGKIYNAFFADRRSGGKAKALAAARVHYQKLLKKHGTMSRRTWAQLKRRPSTSGIVGVRKLRVRRGSHDLWYWMATWSPQLGVVRRKMFSVRKHGATQAKALAVKARNSGVRSMEE
jgi:hypothetical protein